MLENTLTKTLTELEGVDWSEPTYQSRLVINCHRLRRVPLNQFRLEDLRLLVGQSMGRPYLMPMALQCLREDPLAEGDFYPGDLLSSVLRQKADFWRQNPEWYAALWDIIAEISEMPKELERKAADFLQMSL